MEFNLNHINHMVQTDPLALIRECDARYRLGVNRASAVIAENITRSRIVLLSGPSGSGKTTTAHNLRQRLERLGINAHTISLDDYYKDVDPLTTPRGANGEYDFESPDILDLELIATHFREIDAGNEILVPHFDFPNQRRSDRLTPLRAGADEVVIFEGIHALGNKLAGGSGLRAARIYVSARSSFVRERSIVFQGTWSRILRRAVRDRLFRGTSPSDTFAMWDNVRTGEKKYISPFKYTADYVFDTSFEYEISALAPLCDGLFDDISPATKRYTEIMRMSANLALFEPLDASLVPADSLIREFIGNTKLQAAQL